MRKRPRANSETNLLNPASANGTISQRAETSAELGNTSTERADKLMDELLALGHYPKAHGADKNLQKRLSRALAERARRARMDPPPEACAPAEPLDAFAEEAENTDEDGHHTDDLSIRENDSITLEMRMFNGKSVGTIAISSSSSGIDLVEAIAERLGCASATFSISIKDTFRGVND